MKISSRVESVCTVLAIRPSAGFAATNARRSLCTVRDGAKETQRARPSGFSCARSSQWLLSTFIPTNNARHAIPLQRRRHASHTYSTAAAAKPPSSATKPPSSAAKPPSSTPESRHTPEHFMSFVRQEDTASADEHLEFYRDPYLRGYAHPDGPELRVSDQKRDVQYPTKDETFKIDDRTRMLISRLCMAISLRLRHPNRQNLDLIYQLYMQLPEPRMLYLTWHWRDRLLKAMGMPPKRNSESMLRYFALIADVKDAGLTLRRTHWNFALAFATKYSARVTTAEMESALRIWREMERVAKIKGNEVTFNVLFDVASKAGNFTLADMIYNEMENRGIPFNRYHHVSLIYYFGLKLDSLGLRAAYRDLVFAGEMVDTVVLNCVISGLLRCGEESAAEETYERMKNGQARAASMPERNYMMGRVITKVLMMFTRIGKDHPELQPSLQKNIELAPDVHTYKLFVEHYAIRVGDLAKVAQYLDELKFFQMTIHPTIFLALFKGFYLHGGFATSEWSEQRLQGVLQALYQAKDERPSTFRIDRWVVIWALRAAKQCASHEVVLSTFDALAARWDIPPESDAFMHSLLHNVTSGRDMMSPEGRWEGPSYRRTKKDGSPL